MSTRPVLNPQPVAGQALLFIEPHVSHVQVLKDGAAGSIDAGWLVEVVVSERHHKALRRTLQLLAAVLAADR